jgi:hypothetical protein
MPPSLRPHRCPFRNRSRANPVTQCQYCLSAPMFRPTYRPRARIAVYRPDHLAPPSAHSPHHPRGPKYGGTALQRQRRCTVNLAIDAHRAEKFPLMTYERASIDNLRLIPKVACAAKRTVAGLHIIATGVRTTSHHHLILRASRPAKPFLRHLELWYCITLGHFEHRSSAFFPFYKNPFACT